MDNIYKSVCIFLLISATYSYRLQCPSISQKFSRASAICNSSFSYTCLYDTNRDSFSEQCDMNPDYVTQGEKYVITGNLRNVDCASERYQPFPLWSNVSGVCMYQKMLCEGEGQVLYNNGSLISDRTCRCDFTKGFKFIKQPKQKCHCIPSDEDCSCYISKCPDDKVLSPDYECVLKEQNDDSTCPSFENIGTVYIDEKEKKINSKLMNIRTINFRYRRKARTGVLVMCIVLPAVLIIIQSLMKHHGRLQTFFTSHTPSQTGVMSAQLRRSARERTNLPIVAAASARKGANKKVPDTMSVPAQQLPTVITGTPFIPVTSSTGTYPMLVSQTGSDINTSACTGAVDMTSTANTLLHSRVPPDQRECNTVTSQDPPEHSLGHTQAMLAGNDKSEKLLVAAIDFGTTYSGYASCKRHEYDDRPNNPYIIIRKWNQGTHITNKAPTCVLFNPDKKFDSFGYDAMDKFRKNPSDIDFSDWYYFENFKIMLFKEKDMLTKEAMLEETLKVSNPENRKKLKAIDVFAAVISYFKEDLLKENEKQGTELEEDNIHWVITVPAIWELKAKQFMRDAATQAGISSNHLTFALEPEAASMYCRKVPINVKRYDDGKIIAAMDVGSKYVVLDQGGGTTDIAVHEVTGKNTLKEIHQACGGHWGGITVNENFYDFLINLFGEDFINEVKMKDPSDYYEFLDRFENAKTSFTFDNSKEENEFQTLRVPLKWLEHFQTVKKCKLDEFVNTSKYKDDLSVKSDKMRLKNKLFMSFFEYSIQNVVNNMDELLVKKDLEGVKTILIVGGHSMSSILTNAINEKFKQKYHIVIPENPDIAVLKGAVLFGFNPDMMLCRVSQYTYGIATAIHQYFNVELKSKTIREHPCMIDKIFDKCVEVGDVVGIGEVLHEHNYVPSDRDINEVNFDFYATKSKNPKYVTDDGCKFLGTLHFELTGISNKRNMVLKLNTSGTEMVAIITEKSTGKEIKGYFSLPN